MFVKTRLLMLLMYAVCIPGAFTQAPLHQVQAPALGITATSAILIWEDPFTPDYQAKGLTQHARRYHIYQNGARIASTDKKTFTAKNLSPGTDYTFTVVLPESKPEGRWNQVKVRTKNRSKIINVRNSGAIGDGKQTDTEPIQRAIRTCPPGGTVYFPAGHYLVGHLELKSDITLELANNALLSFIGYRPGETWPKTKALLSGADGTIQYESTSLLSASNVHNVVITGKGTIDGNGKTWWPYYKEIARPFTLEFINSSDILIEGITFQDPPFWNNHLLYVDRAIYSEVKFLKVSTEHGVNGDGLNPDASRDVLIVGCLFGNQDDSIAIKSGKYVDDGNKRRRSSERITIRDCVFDGNAAPGSNPLGIALGSESSGGIKHVLIRDCQFTDVASLVNIKTNRERFFASVEDVRIENIRYTNTKHVDRWWNRAPISVDLFYGAPEGSDPMVSEPFSAQTPVFKDIHFSNITVYNPVGRGVYVSGLVESLIRDIDFNRVYVQSRDGVFIQNADVPSVSGITVTSLEEPRQNKK
jgi:polygalacturonase